MSIDSLGPEEKALLSLLAWGLRDKEIARRIDRTPGTVRVMLSRLYAKLGVKDRHEAISVWSGNPDMALLSKICSDMYDKPAYGTSYSPEFGVSAVEHGLFMSLGAMSQFLGVAPHCWNATGAEGCRFATTTTYAMSQYMWEGYLKGDFDSCTAFWHSTDPDVRPLFGRILSAQMLLLQNRSLEAVALAEILIGAEAIVFKLAKEWLDTFDADKHDEFDQAVAEFSQHHPLKHVALVTLFHGYLKSGARGKAIDAANALFVEAEEMRNLLVSTGALQFTPLPKAYTDHSEMRLAYLRVGE